MSIHPISKELKLSRNQVTRLLNELFNDKKLIKIKTSPVLYLSRGSLEVSIRRNSHQMNTNH